MASPRSGTVLAVPGREERQEDGPWYSHLILSELELASALKDRSTASDSDRHVVPKVERHHHVEAAIFFIGFRQKLHMVQAVTALLPLVILLAGANHRRLALALALLQFVGAASAEAYLVRSLLTFAKSEARTCGELATLIPLLEGPVVVLGGFVISPIRQWTMLLISGLLEISDLPAKAWVAGTAKTTLEASAAFSFAGSGRVFGLGNVVAWLGVVGCLRCILIGCVVIRLLLGALFAAAARQSLASLLSTRSVPDRQELPPVANRWKLDLISRVGLDSRVADEYAGFLANSLILEARVWDSLAAVAATASLSVVATLCGELARALRGSCDIPPGAPMALITDLLSKSIVETCPQMWLSISLLGMGLYFQTYDRLDQVATASNITIGLLMILFNSVVPGLRSEDWRFSRLLLVRMLAFLNLIMVLALTICFVGVFQCPRHNFSLWDRACV